jgi:hypothetical protein
VAAIFISQVRKMSLSFGELIAVRWVFPFIKTVTFHTT